MNYLFKTKAAALNKLANLPVYQHPADLLNLPIISMKIQNQQIEGRLPFGENKYISNAHEQLVKSIVNSRRDFLSASDKQRSIIAENQYKAWSQYTTHLYQNLSNTKKITQVQKNNLYEAFKVAKQRNQQRLVMSRVNRFLYEFSKVFKVDLQIHPLVLIRLIHPHYGYLNNCENVKLPIDELVKYLNQMAIASQFFSSGYSLHANQLMSFFFWKLNKSNKPTMTLAQFCKYASIFKFQFQSEEEVGKIFSHTLSSRKDQLKSGTVRYDLWRQIYLDYGL